MHIPFETHESRHYTYAANALDALQGLTDDGVPTFVLAHVLLPHGPNVFDLDGSFLGDEEAAAQGLRARERYDRQQTYTNQRLREMIGTWLARPEAERPIIILQADEGPWPVPYIEARNTPGWADGATPDEIAMKYGVLNAWYLPGGEDLRLDPAMSLIDTFPVLFDRYFGIPYPELAARSYASRDWTHPYDLTDITDRLPAP